MLGELIVIEEGSHMNTSAETRRLDSKSVVVIGGSRGLGRAIVAATQAEGARVLAVARQEEPLKKLVAEYPAVQTLGLDASDENAPAKVFETLSPDVLIVCGGAIPHNVPLSEQSWEQSHATGILMSKCRCSSRKPR